MKRLERIIIHYCDNVHNRTYAESISIETTQKMSTHNRLLCVCVHLIERAFPVIIQIRAFIDIAGEKIEINM